MFDLLNSSEYEKLRSEVKDLVSSCKESHAHGMIFISSVKKGTEVKRSDISKLYERVLKRGQPGDSAVTFDYLFLLEELYQEFFDQFKGPKIKVVNNEEDTEQTLGQIVAFLNSL